jgi:glycosyltransferase involved in cell wall biosynthesis
LLFSVVIPTYNRPRSLAESLSALRAQSIGAAHFEIVVVEDGSPESATTCVDRWPDDAPRLRVIRHPTRKGPAAARNTGANAAAGEYLAFTDDDCRPDPDWLAELHRAAQAHPSELWGGRIENGEPANTPARFNQALITTLQELAAGTPSWFFSSNNLCLTAQAFQDVRGFDESFLEAAGEDREFCLRWQRSGRAMRAVPSAIVYHHHPQSLRACWDMHYRYGKAARKLRERDASVVGIHTPALTATLLRRGFWWTTLLSQAAVACGYLGWRNTAVSRLAILSLILLCVLAIWRFA